MTAPFRLVARAASSASARRGASARAARDDGSMALELAIIAPALIGLLSLLVGFGRYNSATGNLESLAQDGARAATQTRSYADAESAVDALIDQVKGIDNTGGPDIGDSDSAASDDYGLPSSCKNTLQLKSITPNPFTQGAMVTVTVSCTVNYGDLLIPGAPGSLTMTRSFTSPLDPYQGLNP